jgi:hypothetical protein
MGTVQAPNGHAGGFDAVALAELGALLPTVSGAERRILDVDKDLVEERDRLVVGVLGVLQPVQQRIESRDFFPKIRIWGIHKTAILQQLCEKR